MFDVKIHQEFDGLQVALHGLRQRLSQGDDDCRQLFQLAILIDGHRLVEFGLDDASEVFLTFRPPGRVARLPRFELRVLRRLAFPYFVFGHFLPFLLVGPRRRAAGPVH